MFLPVLFGFFMLIGFDQFFIAFHGLFFNNDAWLFNPLTDPIINALPEAYFMHCFILFFVLLEGLFLIGVLIGKRSLKNKERKVNNSKIARFSFLFNLVLKLKIE